MWTEEVFRAMGSVIGRDQMVRGLRHRDCRPFPASFHLHTPLPGLTALRNVQQRRYE